MTAEPAAPRSGVRIARTPAPWVLMYHSVTDYTEDPYRVTVTPRTLDRQLAWLTRHGLRGVGVGELLRARAAGRGAGLVGLTFDDGYQDFLERAVPLLHRHGCTATVFVLPGRLGGDNAWDPEGPRKPLLTADGIRAAADAGMEIGSHGILHLDLTRADDRALSEETARSREELRNLTGTAAEGFCYAYGAVDPRAVRAVRDAGYDYACAIAPGRLTGRHALPRAHVGDGDTAPRLRLKRLLHPLRRRPLPPGALASSRPGTATGTVGNARTAAAPATVPSSAGAGTHRSGR
ncbi:polysaccharide deacetylase family protein [Streptomyces sp. 549]|uniref:polysaccharide deacetylase family protein n=1 Tax=Streptomyces sp. 549 TaxID=3049076 RepID=UPI0024C2AC45|nr:polysaccharide deacetylase family protein [Streptomyces sp. 549]MDK1473571.1 polysaccharide deacetylase family protein [Streptomyces sp. 549]